MVLNNILFILFLVFLVVTILFAFYTKDLFIDYLKLAEERDRWIFKFQEISNLYLYIDALEKIIRRNVSSGVAIYGLDDVGNHLYNILSQCGIKVQFGIDNAGGKIWNGNVNVYTKFDEWPKTDVIIITLNKHVYPEIEKQIIEHSSYKCIYLQDLLKKAWQEDVQIYE